MYSSVTRAYAYTRTRDTSACFSRPFLTLYFCVSSFLRNKPQYPTKGHDPHSGRGRDRATEGDRGGEVCFSCTQLRGSSASVRVTLSQVLVEAYIAVAARQPQQQRHLSRRRPLRGAAERRRRHGFRTVAERFFFPHGLGVSCCCTPEGPPTRREVSSRGTAAREDTVVLSNEAS